MAFGFLANQINDDTEGGLISTVTGNANVNTLLSYWWVKSETLGTVNVGLLSQATDNVALLPDLSGTIIESNAVFFEGTGFFLRPKGVEKNDKGMLHNTRWEAFLWCETTNLGIGADCNGVPENAIRYDSPTIAGFAVSASYGEDDMWDVTARYAGEFGGFKVAGAAGYTHREDERGIFGGGGLAGFKENTELFQTGASVLHVSTGLFVYGLYQNEDASPDPNLAAAQAPGAVGSDNETDVWYLKAGIKQNWFGIGATVAYGEYGQYQNQYGDLKGVPLCASGRFTTFGGQLTPSCVKALGLGEDLNLTGSQVDRWGLGVVQEIDAAAMHLYIRYQHQDLDTDLKTTITGQRVGQGWEAWGVVQAGGVIFF